MPASMTSPSEDLLVALAPGAHAVQRVFSMLLRTLSRPGEIGLMPDHESVVPASVMPLLCLVGHGTPFAVVGTDDDRMLGGAVARVTGGNQCPVEDAAYVAFLESPASADLVSLRIGDAMRPDLAAQILVPVGVISRADDRAGHVLATVLLSLEGPGVDGCASVRVSGIGEPLLGMLSTRHSSFPAGVDVWLVDTLGNVIGLPRSTRVTVLDEQGPTAEDSEN
ncbi:MAG: phosphonate C-P lyase system protein PhnH [Actinobacteria bacterium]|jgi:alpha-D-ribose 1-methylphosphonate 5-triphosphate synthase subunit PhnH|nr:phosphonate C-P lyase system protein PhnH [Actinomycetota bacterium]NBR66274.1 phosphonate C-P lyase system protein PhnH [Actinomycetota bacterium]NBU15599.1 phosphonate C-P lyase system protein PhnH [Actinomycetota bacterium]